MMADTPPGSIVIGIDAHASSMAALRFGLAEARRTGLPVQLVHAVDWPPLQLGGRGGAGPFSGGLHREAERVLTEAAAQARRLAPRTPVSIAIASGSPGRVLVEQSISADRLVIGASRSVALRLGTTGTQVALHAHCPVIVVPAGYATAPPGAPVVVGVDDSESARLATRYAFEVARVRDSELVAVHAWQPPRPQWPHRVAILPESFAGLQDAERRVLDAAVDRWRLCFPHVPVQTRLLPGEPAATLLAASVRAALLVVGSRAISGLRGALTGSVAMQVLHQARCPVAVVHPHRHAELPADTAGPGPAALIPVPADAVEPDPAESRSAADRQPAGLRRG